ncbi:MAG TPA: 5'-3' exonuclease H3TH domain-containing protein, partial [Burkholderiaceae bacterium]
MSEKTLLLVDGSSYLYRAFHALPDLRSADGFPTGAIHGVVAMMKKLREDFPAALGACVFDAPGKTFRDDWYAEYKAHRSPMPDDLVRQIEPIHEAVKLLGWPVLMVPGIEADDVIGTLARAAGGQGYDVIVSTGDKDLAQLVNDRVVLVNTMSNERLDTAGVLAKFGVAPERIVDYLALIGDSVDNVPGVEKVGPKTAAKWIAEHGSLEGVMAAASGMKGVVGENLRKALDWLPQGRRLVTVVTDSDLSGHVADWPAFESLKLAPVDANALLAFYERYSFKSLRRELEAKVGKPASSTVRGEPVEARDHPEPVEGQARGERVGTPVPAAPLEKRYDTILTLEALEAWAQKVEAAEITAIDTETDSLDPMRAQIVGLSVSVAIGEAAYIPLRHNHPGAAEQLAADIVFARLKPWLENPEAIKLGQNIKYDTHVFANVGITVRGYRHDTLLQSYVLEAHRPHNLESLADRHLDRKGLSYEDVCGKGANQIPFSQVDIARATEYSGEDSDMTLHVHRALWPRIAAEPGLNRVYAEIELPTSEVL